MLPSSPGLYVLLLNLSAPQSICVGRLGDHAFPSGWYAYVGSACGPGGLAARIERHRRTDKTLHWHVDHLRARSGLDEVWFALAGQEDECAWAQALAALSGATLQVRRFGSSDCRCRAHLVHFSVRPMSQDFRALIGQYVSVAAFAAA